MWSGNTHSYSRIPQIQENMLVCVRNLALKDLPSLRAVSHFPATPTHSLIFTLAEGRGLSSWGQWFEWHLSESHKRDREGFSLDQGPWRLRTTRAFGDNGHFIGGIKKGKCERWEWEEHFLCLKIILQRFPPRTVLVSLCVVETGAPAPYPVHVNRVFNHPGHF